MKSAQRPRASASRRAVHAVAPVRIDLAGGTVDLWPLYVLFPGAATINVAVRIFAHCWIEPLSGRRVRIESLDQGVVAEGDSLASIAGSALPLPRVLASELAPEGGFRMVLRAEAPAGSGLGGSSALAVAIATALDAWRGQRRSKWRTVEVCRNAEARVLGVPTGDQDYHPPLWGGLVALRFGLTGVAREALTVDLDELERRLVLGYSGVSRSSGLNNWDVFRGVVERRSALTRRLGAIVDATRALGEALEAGNWPAAAAAMDEEWAARAKLAPGIRTPELDRIERAARRAGATAAKVCGAGGGGCIAFLTAPERRGAVEAAIERGGGQVLPSAIVRRGVRVRHASAP
ncbi:MAG: GHMP kinase [Deltaproteobacteria bacterium]|nr:GHMP kinase [Deltaproteobacteria bacterium]